MSAGFASGHALLVGVGGDLPVTVKDAEDLGELLRDPARAGYPQAQVDLVTGPRATRDGILLGLERLAARAQGDPDATVILYYSGHGVHLGPTEQDARYFLVPDGWDPARPAETGVSGEELTAHIRAVPARRMLVLLDCCHAAGLPRSKEAGLVQKAGLPPLGVLRRGRGQVVLTSCRADELSYTLKNDTNSLFTSCLLSGLSGGAPSYFGFAWVLDVVSHVLREVPRRIAGGQHPVLSWADSTESFPICRVPAAKAAPETAPAPMLEWKRRRLQMEIDSLMPAFELRRTLMGRLRVARALATDPTEQLRLERQLDEAERESAAETRRLDQLHAELAGA